MTREEAKEFYPFLQAFAEGRVIECRTKPSIIEGSNVTILGDSKTVGDFITQTTAGVSPALDKLRSLPLTKAAKVIEED